MSKRKVEDTGHEVTLEYQSIDDKSVPRKTTASCIKDRKSKAYEYYLREMRDLNSDIAKSLIPFHEELLRCIEYGESTSHLSVERAFEQYELLAKVIKRKYYPPKGVVLAAGTNEFGQCGLEQDITGRYFAQVVPGLSNAGVVKVVAGGQSSYALTEQGDVLSWGSCDHGCLGRILEEDLYAPTDVFGFMPSRLELAPNLDPYSYTSRDVLSARISDPDATISIDNSFYLNPCLASMKKFDEIIVDMDAGDLHAVALSNTGRVYTFGSLKSDDGKFFHDEFPSDDLRRHPDANERRKLEVNPVWGMSFWPTHVFKLPGKATAVGATFSTSCAIVDHPNGDVISRRLYTWGLGEHGELSRPVSAKLKKSDEEIHNTLVSRGMDPDKDRLSSQDEHNLEVISKEYMVPHLVQFADGENDRDIIKVACGGYHILALARGKDDKTRVFSTGLNNYGQLGLGHKNTVYEFTEIKWFSDRNIEISEMAGGEHFSLFLDSSLTRVYAVGRSCSGQLGYTEICPKPGDYELAPVLVKFLDPNIKFEKLVCGSTNAAALTDSGEVYVWGFADNGSLCVGKNVECICAPQKIDVAKRINKENTSNGKSPVTAVVHSLDFSSQHGLFVAEFC